MQKKNVVEREWQLTRATLFRSEVRQKLQAEIIEDQAAILASFRENRKPDLVLRLFKAFERYLANSLALASYHGIVKGYKTLQLEKRISGNQTKLTIARFIRERPNATDEQICQYLDKCNSRLLALNSTNFNDPKWARGPEKWDEIMKAKLKDPKVRREFEKRFGDTERRKQRMWMESLYLMPGRVMTYLSRARTEAKDARLQNALLVWPRVVRGHEKNARTSKRKKTTK